jgi:uncharacterized protein (TIGR00369 family)
MHYAEGPENLLSFAQALDLSGLEFMQGILNGTHPAPPIGRTLNYKLQDIAKGRAVFRGSPLFDHCNPMGTVHGGWYGTLLDSAMACAVMTMVPKGSFYTTLEYKVNIIRSIPLGMLVDTEGLVDHAGRSTGIAHGEMRGVEDGKLYATGTTTCIIMKP